MKAKIREAGLGTADLLERQQVVARHEQALARLAEAARAKKAAPAKAPGGRHSTDYSRFDHVASDDDDTDEDMPGLADPDAAPAAAAAEDSAESASSASDTDDEMPGLEDQEPPAAAPAAAAPSPVPIIRWKHVKISGDPAKEKSEAEETVEDDFVLPTTEQSQSSSASAVNAFGQS